MRIVRRFERVHTMTDFYDGPRGGIADFDGRPYSYRARFDEATGYSDVFDLRAVDDETLQLAVEDWEIWKRWEDAFLAGQAAQDTHPALPEDRERHREIAAVLPQRLDALPGPVVEATAEFRAIPGKPHSGRGRWLQVRWTPVR
jgi:hypothetical protein